MSSIKFSVLVATSSKLRGLKLQQGLKHGNILFYQADDAESAIERAATFAPDLVFLGTDLAELAWDLAAKLRAVSQDIHIVWVGTRQEVLAILETNPDDDALEQPFAIETVPLKVLAVLDPEASAELDGEAIFKMRKFRRIPVTGIVARIYAPIYEMVPVLDLAHSGMKIRSVKLNGSHIDQEVRLEIIVRNQNMVIQARLAWFRSNTGGLLFTNPKPTGFNLFFEQLAMEI